MQKKCRYKYVYNTDVYTQKKWVLGLCTQNPKTFKTKPKTKHFLSKISGTAGHIFSLKGRRMS